MIKILFIHHSAGWGGAPNCLINLIKDLDQSKYEAEVLLLKYSIIAEKLAENSIKYSVAESIFYKKYYHFFAHSEAGYIKWYQIHNFIIQGLSWLFSRYYFSQKELSRHHFNIVHLNSSVLTDWLAPAKEKAKVIIHIREPFRKGKIDILHYFFKSKINKYADKIIAISDDNAKRINIPKKTVVIYDYCEIPANYPSDSSYASKKVLYLGGSSTSKGFYTLVDTLDYLEKDVKVYFGGYYAIGRKPTNIIQLLKYFLSNEKKRNAAIVKINAHPNAKVIGLIHNVDEYLDEVCCSVSPFWVPHFSCPVIEAHLHTKPAIGTDVEGMDEIIEDKKNGIIVPKNNSQALAEAINLLTSDCNKAKIYGKEGYIIAKQKFTPRNILQFEKVYDQLIHDK